MNQFKIYLLLDKRVSLLHFVLKKKERENYDISCGLAQWNIFQMATRILGDPGAVSGGGKTGENKIRAKRLFFAF